METRRFCICDRCKNPILKKEDGKIIHGDIFVAHPSDREGLIEDAFRAADKDGKIHVSDIENYCFCNDCLKDILFPDTKKEV